MEQQQRKAYRLKYATYGFKAGSIYHMEGDYLVHRNDDDEVLHKFIYGDSFALENTFDDVDEEAGADVHRTLLETLRGHIVQMYTPNIRLGSFWGETKYKEYVFRKASDNISNFYEFALKLDESNIPDLSEFNEEVETTFVVKEGEKRFDKIVVCRRKCAEFFQKWINNHCIGTINFYIYDVESIEHDADKIKSITLKNGTKFLIQYE